MLRFNVICKYMLGIAALVAITAAAFGLNATEMSKKVRIVYSGDTMGYWKPCGCGGSNEGGLGRRSTVIAHLVKENPDTIILDSGNITDLPGKLDVILSIMSKLNYSAIGLGAGDARLGGEFISKAKANKIAVVDSSGSKDTRIDPYLVKNVGGVKIGIVSFGMPLPDQETDEMELRKARYEHLKEARKKSDVLILLDQAGIATDEWLERNAQRLGTPDIVITGSNSRGLIQEHMVGKTHVLRSMYQGKELGVIDVEIAAGEAPKLTPRRVAVDEKYEIDKEIEEQVAQGILSLSKQPSQPESAPVSTVAPGSNAQVIEEGFQAQPYYSPMLCKVCHEAEYNDWAKSGHAKALKTLAKGKNLTADCLPCHSELYRSNRSSTVVDDKPAGVECATCHRAALPHASERKETVARTKVDPKLCLECHTKARSAAYNEKTYFPKVVHSGKKSDATASASSSSKK